MDDKTPQLVIKLAGLMFVATLIAMTILVVTGQDTASIERVVIPLLTPVIVTGVVGGIAAAQRRAHEEHTTDLKQIKAQTNGVLDQRIKDGVRAGIVEVQAEETPQGRHAVTPPTEPPSEENHH